MAFKDTLALVLKWEGVYDNDPDDDGGETCFGITRVFEGSWYGWSIVDGLRAAGIATALWSKNEPLMDAVTVYYQAVFTRLGLDDCPSEKLDACIMGGYVNQGPRVIKWLQEAVADLNVPVKVDGLSGAATTAALKKAICDLGMENALWSGLAIRRARAYSNSKPKYVAGLLNRLFDGA